MNLAADWARLRAERPHLRVRDAAAALGVPEAALVATQPDARPLREPRALLAGLSAVGRVMALTRNAGCVHERSGRYEDVKVRGPVGLVLGPDIDLRLFLDRWGPVWEVVVPTPAGPRPSLQFFSPSGEALHKVYLDLVHGDRAAWDALVEAHLAEAPPQLLPAPAPVAPEAEAPTAALLEDWAALQDTHDFFGMLQRHKVRRADALAFAEGRFTRRLSPAALPALLHQAAADELPFMVFVGNPGVIQIHTGPVRRVVEARGWLNVLDPDFNLHLHQDPAHVAEVWEVRKPTADGDVTAVEVLDAAGAHTAQLFGARKPGRPEDPRWRARVAGLPGLG